MMGKFQIAKSIPAWAFAVATCALPLAAAGQTATGSDAQLITPPSVLSETAPELHALFDMMGVYEMFGILSTEGILSADEMEADMFPGQGGAAWPAVVAGIYSTDRLIGAFEAAVPADRFTPELLSELTAFFESDLGQRIAAGEVTARRAFLEPGVEEAAEEMAVTRAGENDPRIALLTEFIAVNDLIERNVTGALNSNFAFYRGLADGGAFETDIPEELMLTEVWGQEAEVRTDTTSWLYAYQVMAYADLTDEDLRAYIALSETEAGETLNEVLFLAFDVVFDQVSFELGAAAAVFISGEET